METKMIRVPFNVELAKQITNGEKEGRIVTRDGESARIVCWDFKKFNQKKYILGVIDRGEEEVTWIFNLEGQVNINKLESKNDLFLEVPEYTTFKDGDIYKTGNGSIGIYNGNYKPCLNLAPFYAGLRKGDKALIYRKNDSTGFGVLKECTLDVTEEERQELIDALKQSNDQRAKAA